MTNLRAMYVYDGDGNKIRVIASTDILKVGLFDGYGNPIESLEGAINIHDADVHTNVLNIQFSRQPGTSTTLTAAAAAGDTQLTVASIVGFAVGNYIDLNGLNSEMVHPIIRAAPTGTTIPLNRPLDNGYASGTVVNLDTLNMNVLGTIGAPVSYRVQPASGVIWHLTRILIEMTHTGAGDNGLFGSIGALTNGVLLRRYDGATGLYQTFTVWRSNSDLVTDMYDVTYAPRSGGGGAYGTNARGSFRIGTGSIVELDGTAGDFLEVLIQDDLTTLSSFRIKAQGHPTT